MNNQSSITQDQKQYIIYNLKRFFEYYKLDENIIKVNEDIILLKKMKEEIDNLLNFIPERQRSKLVNNIHQSTKHKKPIKSEDLAYRHIPNSKNNTNQLKKQVIINKKRNLTNDNIKSWNTNKKIIKNKIPIHSPNKNNNYRDSYLKKIHHNIKSEDLNENKNKIPINKKIRGTTPISSRNKNYLNDIQKEKSVDNIIKKRKNNVIKNKVQELKRPLTPNLIIKKKNVDKNSNINHITKVTKITPAKKIIGNTNKSNSNVKNTNKYNKRESPLNKNKRNITPVKKIIGNTNKSNSNVKNTNKYNKRESPLNKNKRNFKTSNNSKKKNTDNSLSKDKNKNKTIIKSKNEKIIIKPKKNNNNNNNININIKKDINSNSDSDKEIKEKENKIIIPPKKINAYIIPEIDFQNKNLQALYFSLYLNYFDINKKIKIIFSQPKLFKQFSTKNLFHELYSNIEKEFIEISKFLLKYDMNKISIPFSPNKTAKRGLTFITEENEKNLIENEQPNEIIIIFKVVLLFLEEDISNINYNKIIKYLFIDIFQKYQVKNIKDLFLKHIINKINLLNEKYINEINNIIGDKPELLTPSEVLKYNRNVSYMTFIIKDIYYYLFEKTDDGIYFYQLRQYNRNLIILDKKLERLKKFL